MARGSYSSPWWLADEGRVWERVFPYVAEVERNQSDTYDRFVRLSKLYDPYSRGASDYTGDSRAVKQGVMTENVIASNCDAITGTIAATEVRARFMTDDGDWSTQRQARLMEWYAEELSKLIGLDDACRKAFHECSLKGTGLVKVYVDAFDEIRAERVMPDDIVVDDAECRGGAKPRQMHQRKMVGREVLCAEFPEHEDEIEKAQNGSSGCSITTWTHWADYRPIERDELVVLESWKLPIGREGRKGYKPGRHVISIDGCDLIDEEYEDDFFPFAKMVWTERPDSWFGIGGAERIIGHQRTLNKRNWQADRQLDNHAVPTTYVRLADAALSVKTTNRLGTIAVYKADLPHTVIPPAVSPETYKSREDAKASAFEEFGQSRMAASSMKPAGIDSGVALREYKDQTTQRFASQEKGFEQLKLDGVWLSMAMAKKLGKAAPKIVRRSRFGVRDIRWSQVDLGEVKVQIVAASNLARTPAGRTQLVMEFAQSGLISQDEARRLLQHPDLEAAMSRYTAALEDIEECIEEIEMGAVLVPEPFQDNAMIVDRGQKAYLKIHRRNAPEEVLESLRQFIVIAADRLAQAQAPAAAPAAAPPGDMAAAGAALPAPAMPSQPVAALAPEAMNLVAA